MTSPPRPRLPGSVRAFAPATVGNVACGFDVMGLAVEHPGDVVAARRAPGRGVVKLDVRGDGGRIPDDPLRNSAGVAAVALLEEMGSGQGLELEVRKGLPLSGGMGGSAASAVAAVVAVDGLLGAGASRETLLRCALAGERAACGSDHPDNAAPCLYGGIVLVRSTRPLDVVPLPVPADLAVALVRPHLEVETAAARRLLGDTLPLRNAVTQWGNVAGLVAGLYRADFDLISRSLVDVVAEPLRARKVPGFGAAKAAAYEAGALGCSLSGSGPTLFALCRGLESARRAGVAMRAAFASAASLDADVHVSPVAERGARLLDDGEP